MPGLAPYFSNFLARLGSHDVDYLIVGGYALVFHGCDRVAPDLDLWIRPTPEAWARVSACLETLGYRLAGPIDRFPARPGRGIGFGAPPDRIELLRSIGLDFATCFARRIDWWIGELRAAVLSLDDLRRSKRASGRLQDLEDLADLRRARRPRHSPDVRLPKPGA